MSAFFFFFFAENAAGQLHAALEKLCAEELSRKQDDQEYSYLLGEDYWDQPWHVRYYRFNTAWMLKSWVGVGVKHAEAGIRGETMLGDELSGWSRVKLSVLGSVELVLAALPLAKGAAAAGGKLGSLASAGIQRAMAIDIVGGFGERAAARLAATKAGQGFLKAYNLQ